MEQKTQSQLGSSAAFLVLVCFLAYGWVLFVPFRLDDYVVIPEAMEYFAKSTEVKAPLKPEESQPSAKDLYRYRPTPAAFWAIVGYSSEPPLKPAAFHAVSLIIHVGSALLLWSLLRVAHSPTSATLGAGLFALHAAPGEAVSWIAALGDPLVVLLCLILLRILVCESSKTRLFFATLCAALACLSKESGALQVIVSLGVLALTSSYRRASRFVRLSVPLLGIAIAAGLRAWHLGTFDVRYAPGVAFGIPSLDFLRTRGLAHLDFIARPWTHLGADMGLPHSELWRALPFLLPLLAVFFAFRRVAGAGCVFLLAFGILLLPAVAVPTDPEHISRALYAALIPMAFLWGRAGDALLRVVRGRRFARACIVAGVVAIALPSLVGLYFWATFHLELRSATEERVAGIRAAFARNERAAALVIGHEQDARVHYTFGNLYPGVFRPPMSAASRLVAWYGTESEARSENPIWTWSQPILVFQPDRSTGRMTLRTTLPELSASHTLPRHLIPAPSTSKDEAVFVPSTFLPPRAVRALKIAFHPGDTLSFEVTLTTDARSWTLRETLPAERVVHGATFLLEDLDGFAFDSEFQSLRIRGAQGRLQGAPQIEDDIPKIDLELGSPHLEAGEIPRLKMSPPLSSSELRVDFDLMLGTEWNAALSFRAPPQATTFLASREGVLKQPLDKGFVFETVPDYYRLYLLPKKIRVTDWRVRVRGLSEGGHANCRSKWIPFSIRSP